MVSESSGLVTIPLLTPALVQYHLSKASTEFRKKAKYIHIGGIQVLIKALFRKGLNSPVTIWLMDNRHLTSSNALLGIVNGNLCYKSLLFSVFPNYAVSLRDKNRR